MKKICKVLGILFLYEFMIYMVTPIILGLNSNSKIIAIELFQNSVIILVINLILLLFSIRKCSKQAQVLSCIVFIMFCIIYYTTEPLLNTLFITI